MRGEVLPRGLRTVIIAECKEQPAQGRKKFPDGNRRPSGRSQTPRLPRTRMGATRAETLGASQKDKQESAP